MWKTGSMEEESEWSIAVEDEEGERFWVSDLGGMVFDEMRERELTTEKRVRNGEEFDV